jgi:transketolase
MDLTDNEKYLRSMAIQIRANIIEMIPPGKVGHLGGSSSIADVLAVLYFERMKNLDPKDLKNPNRDRLIFSKGHAVLAQYAALVELNYFSRDELKKVKTLNGTLQGHPDIDKTPGLEAVTGSLGQGLSISGGMAMALKLDKNDAKVFCVCGDGELAEGQLWEAAMSSVNYKLDNLCLFIDKNSVQASGTTQEIFPIDNISGKFAAFGWHVIDIDGHNIKEIQAAIAEADATKGLPTVIVAKTIKSKGFPFAEGKCQYHNASLTEEQYQECLDCIKKMREEL